MVERLSRKAPGGPQKESGKGYPVPVDGGKPGSAVFVGGTSGAFRMICPVCEERRNNGGSYEIS